MMRLICNSSIFLVLLVFGTIPCRAELFNIDWGGPTTGTEIQGIVNTETDKLTITSWTHYGGLGWTLTTLPREYIARDAGFAIYDVPDIGWDGTIGVDWGFIPVDPASSQTWAEGTYSEPFVYDGFGGYYYQNFNYLYLGGDEPGLARPSASNALLYSHDIDGGHSVTPATAIPEPSSYAMSVIAIGCCMWVLRNRKQKF